ncbi:hypothetical protein F7725_007119 [Dissostichus mawsoni]|uniref:TRIM8/14/16/25/29/45/65 coiled-coil region domain-containing protein n=1 Tax=Dissostichus mawsoni TaxID=36200 RepID=A0A7J5XXH3_DISMA|nr:hypothetical protein F7725_007119 [Dissostichus mawsoni]
MADHTSQDYFSCSLCVNLLRDPFLYGLHQRLLNEADYTGIYICPQCNITFTQRPVLRPNATLSMKLLGVSQAEIRQKCQERVKELEELKTAVESLKNSAQRAMVDSQKMFEDMIRSIERMRSEVSKLIGINEKAAFNQSEALIERLDQEIDELKKKEAGLKQLYSTDDHIHFLQNFNYLCTPTDDGYIPRVTVNPDFSFGAVRKAVAEIKDRLEEFGREELLKISKSVNEVPVYTTESRTLDRRSRAYKELYVSENSRKVLRTRDLQPAVKYLKW